MDRYGAAYLREENGSPTSVSPVVVAVVLCAASDIQASQSPENLRTPPSTLVSPPEIIMAEVRAADSVYRLSGGLITLSGGVR